MTRKVNTDFFSICATHLSDTEIYELLIVTIGFLIAPTIINIDINYFIFASAFYNNSYIYIWPPFHRSNIFQM